MARTVLFLFSLFILSATVPTGYLSGTITDAQTGDMLPFINVEVISNGKVIYSTQTNFDGYYEIRNITGQDYYDVKFGSFEYRDTLMYSVRLSSLKTIDLQLKRKKPWTKKEIRQWNRIKEKSQRSWEKAHSKDQKSERQEK